MAYNHIVLNTDVFLIYPELEKTFSKNILHTIKRKYLIWPLSACIKACSWSRWPCSAVAYCKTVKTPQSGQQPISKAIQTPSYQTTNVNFSPWWKDGYKTKYSKIYVKVLMQFNTEREAYYKWFIYIMLAYYINPW